MSFKVGPHLNKKDTVERHVEYSKFNGMIPRLYVPEWKTDMKNRSLILENANCGYNPNHEHNEPLYKDKREQMDYNVEVRSTVDGRYTLPKRCQILGPWIHQTDYRHVSSCLYYKDGPDPRAPKTASAFEMNKILAIGDKCRQMDDEEEEDT